VPPWAQRRGVTVEASSSADAAGYEELLEGAESLAYLLDGLVADPLWSDAARVLLTGPGSALLTGALADTGRMPEIEICESAAGLAVLRAQVEDQDAVSWSQLADRGQRGEVDLAVASLALTHRTDDEAAALLGQLAQAASTVVVVESSRPDGLSPRAAEAALHSFAVTGAPLRDSEAIAALGARAGWRISRVVSLGWGVEATVLER